MCCHQHSPFLSPQGNFGCQSVLEMMRFYMEEVLPSALRSSEHHQRSVGDLGNLLLSLKAMMRRCVSGLSTAARGAIGHSGERGWSQTSSKAGGGSWVSPRAGKLGQEPGGDAWGGAGSGAARHRLHKDALR